MMPESHRADLRLVNILIDLTGLSKTTIADRMGLSPQDLGRVIHAHRPASLHFRERFFAAVVEELDRALFPPVGPPK